jgi:hypothetical protein
MPITYRNRPQIFDKSPETAQALDDICSQFENVCKQVNASPIGVTNPPPAPTSLTVTAAQGIFDAKITDNNPVSRGVNYFLEHSLSPSFNAPTTIDIGQSRNHRASLGNQTLYWRAHSSYPTSSRSGHAYHGTQTNPIAVVGGGASTGPVLQSSSGSGTSSGASGSDGAFGNNPTRGNLTGR